MKYHQSTFFMVLFLLSLGQTYAQPNAPLDVDIPKQEAKRLRETVLRFFEGDSGYQPGDLIVQSQVAELQDYLRRTRGPIHATHSRIRKRVLADNACLARAFYRLGGRKLLGQTAIQLGGYAPLDRLCQTKAGRRKLSKAILAGDMASLVAYAQAIEKTLAESPDAKAKQATFVTHRAPKIYSVEDFVLAITATPKSTSKPDENENSAMDKTVE